MTMSDGIGTARRVYEAPTVTVWGAVAELTSQNLSGTKTDVPLGSPVGAPPFSIFS